MRNQIFAIAGLFLCGACTYTEPPGPIPYALHESYIEGYYDIDKVRTTEMFYFSVNESNKSLDRFDHNKYDPAKKSYQIDDGIAILTLLSSACIYEDSSSEILRNRYEELRNELGDNSFNKTLPYNADLPKALTGMLDKIRIYVNEDYMAEYPAGTDVSCLFTLFYEQPYLIVLNNYQALPNTYHFGPTPPIVPQAFYKDLVSEVDLRGKKALGAEFYFLLNGAPAKTGEYSFTVEVQTSDGRTLTATTKPIPISVP